MLQQSGPFTVRKYSLSFGLFSPALFSTQTYLKLKTLCYAPRYEFAPQPSAFPVEMSHDLECDRFLALLLMCIPTHCYHVHLI